MSLGKVLIFSDIHFGENLNSPLKLDIACKNIDFIIELIKSNNVDTVIFCGDWFHSRASLSVNTFYQSYQALSKLTAVINDKLYMIVGNHDSYYKNSIDIHSLKSFEQIPNVKIIESIETINIAGKTLTFCPWGTNIEKLKNIKSDYLFGHFEPNGAELTGTIAQGCEYSIEDLTAICPLVFSGHYHISKEYPTETGTLIMVGSPSQQNWGDVNSKRGCYILNLNTNNYRFVENTTAPVYNKILYSEILEKKKLPLKKDITNNFIKLIVDCPYKYSQINELIEKLHKVNPLTIEPEYFYSDQIKLDLNGTDQIKTFKTYIEYITQYIKDIEVPEEINKDKLTNLAVGIYNKIASEGNE